MGPRQRRTTQRAKTHAVPVVIVSLFGFLLVAGVAFGIGMLGNVNKWLSDLPDYTDANEYSVSEPTRVLDANGNELATLFSQNRESITKDQVSQYVLKGTVDVEDERFYEHNGVDLVGIMRAVVAQLTGRSEGASTITQQLVRNTILSEEQFDQTIERKVREAWIAIQMEKMYSKDEILMMYLNTIYYGHSAYGIQAAAKTYFSKNASDLTLAEAALLVGLPNSPSYYDPTANPDGALDRRNKVLDNMLRLGSITQEEHDAAQAEPLALNVTEPSDSGITVYSNPYFVDYVKSLLQEEFSTDVLFKGGLTVKTTLDPTVQKAAEDAAVGRYNSLRNAEDFDIGMTVIDPKTGYIKAMVGGSDYNRVGSNGKVDHINHATTRQQVGSTFKAFTLATAIKMGMDPDGVKINCNSGLVWPQVAGREKYTAYNIERINYGMLSLREATVKSSNTGFIQVAETVGNQNIFELCRDLGVDTSDMNDVLTATLGVGYITTVEMAEAYATFANGGYHRDAVAITEIDSRDGTVLYKHKDDPKQVLTAGEAAAVTDVLEDVMKRGSGKSGTPRVNQPVAGKTGTASGGKNDAMTALWFCGYTPQYAVAISYGDYMGGITGVIGQNVTTVPLPIFKQFMETVLANTPREEFPTGEKPTYKDSSEWEFSHTNSKAWQEEQDRKAAEEAAAAQKAAEDEAAQKAAEEEAKKQQEAAQQQQQQPTTPTPPITTPETPSPDGGTTTGPTTPDAQSLEEE